MCSRSIANFAKTDNGESRLHELHFGSMEMTPSLVEHNICAFLAFYIMHHDHDGMTLLPNVDDKAIRAKSEIASLHTSSTMHHAS